MKLEQLIEAAELGAWLSHPSMGHPVRVVNGKFVPAGVFLPPGIPVDVMDDNWRIKTPAPGACQICAGATVIEYDDGAFDCLYCKGTGLDPKSEPVEVRPLQPAREPQMVDCPPCNPMDNPPDHRDEAHDREICKRIFLNKSCNGINCTGDDCPFHGGEFKCGHVAEPGRYTSIPVSLSKQWLKAHGTKAPHHPTEPWTPEPLPGWVNFEGDVLPEVYRFKYDFWDDSDEWVKGQTPGDPPRDDIDYIIPEPSPDPSADCLADREDTIKKIKSLLDKLS